MPSISNALVPPTLSEDFCTRTPQQQVNEIIGGTQIVSDATFDNIILSQTTPGINDRDKAWQRLNTDNSPEHIYTFANGVWMSLHPVPASSSYRVMWVGAEADLWMWDGGDGQNPSSVTPTQTAGAMWEVDHAFDGLFPVGSGTMQPSATPVAVLQTGGLDQITLSSAQVPDHTHLGKAYYRISGGPLSGDASGLYQATSPYVPVHESAGHTHSTFVANNWDYAGVLTESPQGTFGQVVNTVPPYIGVFFIKRTRRTHYNGSTGSPGAVGVPAFIVYVHLAGASPEGTTVGYLGEWLIDLDTGNRFVFAGTDGGTTGWI